MKAKCEGGDGFAISPPNYMPNKYKTLILDALWLPKLLIRVLRIFLGISVSIEERCKAGVNLLYSFAGVMTIMVALRRNG